MRLANLGLYWYLIRTFRNGWQMVDLLRSGGLLADGTPLPLAETRDGVLISHPPQSAGLLGSLIEIWRERVYEPPEFAPLRPGDAVLDIGANVGVFSVWALRRWPGTRVIAVEPTADGFDCLQANLAPFAARDRATAHRLAAGRDRGHVRIERPTGRSIDVRTAVAAVDDPDRVETRPFVELLDLAGVEVAYLKVDIEGAERDLFASATDADLRRCERIALEYHDNLKPGTLAFLKQRLEGTHTLRVEAKMADYGMLYACRRG